MAVTCVALSHAAPTNQIIFRLNTTYHHHHQHHHRHHHHRHHHHHHHGDGECYEMEEEVDPTAAAAAYTKPKVIIRIFMTLMHNAQLCLQ